MAGLSAYCGIQGSGKSYEVVSNVILSAVASGRRVVTNVAGLQIEEIYRYVTERDKPAVLGTIVQVTNDDVSKSDFFPVEADDPAFGSFEPIVKGGDVVVLDEVWRWYATGEKMPEAHMKFIRMHRHHTDERGLTCDIVLITQSIDDLQRKVKAVVEKTFVMSKHKALGMSNRYVINIYQSGRITKTTHLRTMQGTYEPKIYALYKSHSQNKADSAKEVDVDKRATIFGGFLFKVGLPLAILCFFGGFWYIWKFFHPAPVSQVRAESSEVIPGQSGPRASRMPPTEKSQDISLDLRVVGSYVSGGAVVYLVSEGGKVRKMVDPKAVKQTVFDTEILMPDGRFASRWWGSSAQSKQSGQGATQ